MRQARWLAIAIGALSFLNACTKDRDEGFEGEIISTMTTDAGSIETLRYFVKGERIRMETTADRISTTQIVDISTNDIFVLDSTSKTYRTMTDPSAVHTLRRELFDSSGKRVVFTEANHVEQVKVPTTLVVVPPGYTLVR